MNMFMVAIISPPAVILQSHDVTCEPEQMDDPPPYPLGQALVRSLLQFPSGTVGGLSQGKLQFKATFPRPWADPTKFTE